MEESKIRRLIQKLRIISGFVIAEKP